MFQIIPSTMEPYQLKNTMGMVSPSPLSCIVRNCNKVRDLMICQPHLDSPIVDNFEILSNVEIKPYPAAYTECKKLKLANALMSINPKKLCAGKKLKRICRQQVKALESNSKNIKIIELTSHFDVNDSSFYGEDMGGGYKSSKHFHEFKPEMNTNQVFIDKSSRELLFCIPDPKSQDTKSQNSLKSCLLRTFKFQPDNQNKNATVRKTDADKWIFTGNSLSTYSKYRDCCF